MGAATEKERHRKKPAATGGQRGELQAVLDGLFDVMFRISMLFGGIALAASAYRSITGGLYGTLLLHMSMYAVAVVFLVFRRRFSSLLTFYVLLFLAMCDVVYSLLAGGAAVSRGMISMMALAVFAGMFLGLRAGFAAVAACAALMLLCFTGIHGGIVDGGHFAADSTAAPADWIVNLCLFITYVVPVIIVANGLKDSTKKSLRELGASNDQLTREMLSRNVAEKALQESETKYRAIFDNAVEGLFQVTPDGRALNYNPALARMIGYSSPEDMRRSVGDGSGRFFADPAASRRMKRMLDRSGFLENFETRLYHRDGDTIWASINARAVHDERGNILLYEGSIVDITKRRTAEASLLESESKYRSVVDHSLAAFYIMQEKLFRFVNPRFCAMLGYRHDEIVDRLGPLDMVHPESREQVLERLEAGADDPAEHASYEIKAVHKDGRVMTLKIFRTKTHFSGRPAVFGTMLDVTRERVLEAQLRHAQKIEAVGSLASGIAHDFNNVLTALQGYAGLLLMNLDRETQLAEYAENILLASKKGADLTKSLLTFSRQQDVVLQVVDLNAHIRATKKLLRRLLLEDMQFETVLSDDTITIMADTTQIDQILFNLTTNARDAMSGGGTLTIRTMRARIDTAFVREHGFGSPGAYGLLAVSDTGVGIDETTRKKIFEPFYTTKEIGRGTGLGLATVYGIVKQHNGYITLESRPGSGTTFYIYFPVVSAAAPPREIVNAAIQGGHELILIAEDDDIVRPVVCEALQSYGYRTLAAVNGEEAVSVFKNNPGIDLAILDSVMPRKNGGDVFREITKINPQVKVLFTSGHAQEIVLGKGINASGVNFLQKPVSMLQLVQKVREVLDG